MSYKHISKIETEVDLVKQKENDYRFPLFP